MQENSPNCPRVSLFFFFKSLFLFKKFLLLNPATPYKEGPVLLNSAPLQLGPGLSGSGPHMAQLSTLPSRHPPVSVGLSLHPYSPPCHFKQPGVSPCCSSLVWQGREPLTGSLPGVLRQGWQQAPGLGLQLPWSRAGPRDLIVLKQSLYCHFFQCPLYFLVSYLHICRGIVGCSLCSSVDRLGVSPMCRGKWTPLPPISPPSSLSPL